MQESHHGLKWQEKIFQLNTRKQLSKKFALWKFGENHFICTRQPKPDNLSTAPHFSHSRCFSPGKELLKKLASFLKWKGFRSPPALLWFNCEFSSMLCKEQYLIAE